jgi:transposase
LRRVDQAGRDAGRHLHATHSELKERLSAEDTVRNYKSLSQAERAFRCLKGVFDLLVRPVRHRTAERVPAHFFLCMLTCYVEWHMRKALAPILFRDEELSEDRKRRDPILPARSIGISEAEQNRGRPPVKSDEVTFNEAPDPTPTQAKAYELLGLLPVVGKQISVFLFQGQ